MHVGFKVKVEWGNRGLKTEMEKVHEMFWFHQKQIQSFVQNFTFELNGEHLNDPSEHS
jgi:hypothetical protein